MSDFDPSVATDPVGGFNEQRLTIREHMDPDKHWVGETLPAPGTAEVRPTGRFTATGTSPYPARADHSHDTNFTWAYYQHPDIPIANGQEKYFDNFTFNYGTANMLAPGSKQLFIFPQTGLWQFSVHWILYNPIPHTTANWVQYWLAFNNVSHKPTMYIGPSHNAANIGFFYTTSIYHFYYDYVDATRNVQVSAYNNTGGNVGMSISAFQITRLAGWYT